jgi:hypothetical protein
MADQVNGTESWYVSSNVKQIVGMFHSQSSLSKFLCFKSHLANLELSPVESYQIFDFVNFSLDVRPRLLKMNIKTPNWAFCISPVIHEMGNVDLTHIMAEENPKTKNVQSSEHLWHQKRLQCLS